MPGDVKEKVGIQKPTWGAVAADSAHTASKQIKTTWLGHACFLVELPAAEEGQRRGARILFDPVFSDRCSPFQWIGPKRFTR